MHLRFQSCIGLPVTEERTDLLIAVLSGIVLHPDKGIVEGFYVRVPAFLHTEEFFLSTMDILHWGKFVRVRSHEVFTVAEDIVRLRPLFEEGRTIINQRIRTEQGIFLGMCKDVQFDTKTFQLEWIFPKKNLRWRPAIPVTTILEVRPEAIIVRDNAAIPEPATGPSVLETLDPLKGTTMSSQIVEAASECSL